MTEWHWDFLEPKLTPTSWHLRDKRSELFFLSLSSLFIELIFIRWLASDFRSLCVFKTFPLVTCLVGLGAGSAIAQNEKLAEKLYSQFPMAFYIAAALIKILAVTGFCYFFLPSLNMYQWSEVHIGLEFVKYQAIFMVFLLVLLAPPFFACMTIGARIGVLFNSLTPLSAYCINIGGALAGSLLFALTCYSWLPLWALLFIPMIVSVTFLPEISKRYRMRSWLLLLAAILIAWIPIRGPQVLWSPYTKIEVFPIEAKKNGETERIGTVLNVGHLLHQIFLPKHEVEPGEQLEPSVTDVLNMHNRYYDLLFKMVPHPHNVLILGAGMGMDIWEFVRRGVDHIDAVEIDPLIADLGRKNNPAYTSDRVHIIVDDARHYVNNCTKKYDLVFLATLDSSTLAGLSSSTRVDSYVHTAQSFAAIKKILAPDGVMALAFGSGGYKWLRERIRHTLEQAYGYLPIAYDGDVFFFFTGEPVRTGALKPLPTFPGFVYAPPSDDFTGQILNDDWPFLYMRNDRVDVPFLIVLLEVVLLALFAGRKLLFDPQTKYWGMFFLGGAFMLIELCAISRLALLYSATWITSSLVIICILLMILFANVLVLKYEKALSGYLNACYVALIASLLLVYFVPFATFLDLNRLVDYSGHVSLTVFSLLPCFFAALIFALRFNKVSLTSRALAFNLFGCVAGAMLEYLSNLWGLRSLLLVATALYVASWTAKE
jgi:hypothetical protein